MSNLAKYTTNPGMLHWEALIRLLGSLYATQEDFVKYKRNEAVVDGIDARGTLKKRSCSRHLMALF